MKKTLALASLAVLGATLLAGCNVGNAPAGMDNDDAKAAIERMTPEQQIRFYNGSPMPPAEKQKKFAEIEAKTGVKAKDVLGGAPVIPGGGMNK